MPQDPTRTLPQIMDREERFIQLDAKVSHLLGEIETIKQNPDQGTVKGNHGESARKGPLLLKKLVTFETSLDLHEKGMDTLEEGHLIIFLHQLKKEIARAMGERYFDAIHDSIDEFLTAENF